MTTPIMQLVLLFWTLLAFFLVTLFWSLYRQLGRKRAFLWWMWAWVGYGVYYGANVVEAALPSGLVAAQQALILLQMLAAYSRAPFLFFGARRFADEERPEPRWHRLAIIITLAAGALFCLLSFTVEPELAAINARNIPRVALAGAALLYTAAVFVRRWRASASRAALVTAVATGLGGAIDVA